MSSLYRKVSVVFVTTVICFGLVNFCTSNANADWYASGTYSPGWVYVGDNVTYTFNLKNTGTSSFQVNSATLSIDWGSTTTTKTMTGVVAIAPGDSGRLTCSFKVPQVVANTYSVLIEIEGKAVGDLWASTRSYNPTLIVKPIPDLVVTVQASLSSGQAPLSTTLSCTPTSGVSPYTYAWTFGDGTTGSQSMMTHQYSRAGTFVATCLVTDSKGQTTSDSVTVTVTAIPTVTVSVQATKTSGQAPMSSTFSATPGGGVPGYTYYWTFGDGTTSTQSSVSHQYTKGGTYTATCLVTDSNGQKASDSVTITVQANPADVTDNSGGTSPILLIGIVAVVACAIAAVAILVMRRK